VTAPRGRRSAAAWSSSVARVRGLLAVALAGALLVSLGSAAPPTSAQPATQTTRPAQPAATPIPVPEIAQRAEEVATLLRQSAERVATDPEVQASPPQRCAFSTGIRAESRPRPAESRGLSPAPLPDVTVSD
jgi:hypothetical protein